MKNVILGIVGGFLILYSVVLGLSVYRIQVHENALNNTLSDVVVGTLERYYLPYEMSGTNTSISQKEIEKEVEEELHSRLANTQKLTVNVVACDMNMGILSVKVEETYRTPCGIRTYVRQKTAIVERK